MFCPQCGTESTADLKYCRSCGANLKVIGKAVTLSEAIARSDGVPAKIKELVSNIKIAHVTEEVSRAMEKMNQEITRSSIEHRRRSRWRREKTAEQRRERQIVKGTVTFFFGSGLTIFLYFLSRALILKLPPDVVARIPFDVDRVVHTIWAFGLIPTLSGLGRIIAGLTIRRDPARQIEFPQESTLRIDQPTEQTTPVGGRYDDERTVTFPREVPDSVTDRTTNILEHKVGVRQTDEIKQ